MKLVTYTFTDTEKMLGTKPLSANVASDYIQSKAKDAEGRPKPTTDEERAAEAAEALHDLEKQATIFYRTPAGIPFIYDYQVMGFLKETCGSLRRGNKADFSSVGMSAYKTKIEACVYIVERNIELHVPDGKDIIILERPLRSQTPQGPITALARSEAVPVGTTFKVTFMLLNDEYESMLDEWLAYGTLRGMGQWRSAGFGTFIAEKGEVKEVAKKDIPKFLLARAQARAKEQEQNEALYAAIISNLKTAKAEAVDPDNKDIKVKKASSSSASTDSSK